MLCEELVKDMSADRAQDLLDHGSSLVQNLRVDFDSAKTVGKSLRDIAFNFLQALDLEIVDTSEFRFH